MGSKRCVCVDPVPDPQLMTLLHSQVGEQKEGKQVTRRIEMEGGVCALSHLSGGHEEIAFGGYIE
jgi:hypothetical protein